MAYQFKVYLEGSSNPRIWRRIVAPQSFSFYDLHLVIQAAMGWKNQHQFAFHPWRLNKGNVLSVPKEGLHKKLYDGTDARFKSLTSFFEYKGQRIPYEYNLESKWIHSVIYEKFLDEPVIVPHCLRGKGTCPSEICNGIEDYYAFITKVNTSNSEDYIELRESVGLGNGENWQPDAFDLMETNSNIKHWKNLEKGRN